MTYTPVTVSASYNATPPADTGATTEANRFKWSTIKTKLPDHLKTAIDSIDDNIATAITAITSAQATATTNLNTLNANYTAATSVLYAPSTTAMLFIQTAAPTGWTKGAAHNNKAIRLVNGTASSGGSTAFTTVLASRTLVAANMPVHTHTWSSSNNAVSLSRTSWLQNVSQSTHTGNSGPGATCIRGRDQDKETIAATGSVSGTTSSVGSGTAMSFAVRYVDSIIATKD